MDALDSVRSAGITLPSPAYIFGAILFGIIGFAAYRYGKKIENQPVRWIGAVLMFFPYLVSQTWLLYGVGAGLCFAIYYYRR